MRKTFFRSRATQRHTIQQQLSTGSAEQESGLSAFLERLVQFLPGSFELRCGAHMPELIQAGKLQQNVQTANKGARRRSSIAAHFLPFPNRPFYNTRTPCCQKTSAALTFVALLAPVKQGECCALGAAFLASSIPCCTMHLGRLARGSLPC
jgi:hypothetical protein